MTRKEKKAIYMKEWREKNRDKIKEYDKKHCAAAVARNRERNKNNPEKYLWQRARDRAKLQGREFDIEVEDIVIPRTCPYLGVPLTAVTEGTSYSPSIDRIDTNRGYVKGNIEVISRLANRMKNNATVEELLLFANGVNTRYAS